MYTFKQYSKIEKIRVGCLFGIHCQFPFIFYWNRISAFAFVRYYFIAIYKYTFSYSHPIPYQLKLSQLLLSIFSGVDVIYKPRLLLFLFFFFTFIPNILRTRTLHIALDFQQSQIIRKKFTHFFSIVQLALVKV
jgi:hypothetical protein